jgi:hypothetical protein
MAVRCCTGYGDSACTVYSRIARGSYDLVVILQQWHIGVSRKTLKIETYEVFTAKLMKILSLLVR